MFTKRQSIILVATAIVLMLNAISCGSLPTPGSATTPFPVGVFVDASGNTLTFEANGTVAYRGADYDDAKYLVTGDQVSFTEGRCYQGSGTYQWSYDGKVLIFKALGLDPCGGRSTALGVSFTKKQ